MSKTMAKRKPRAAQRPSKSVQPSKPPRIDPEFRDLIPALSEQELGDLTANVVATARVHTPLVVWKETGILLDGHNRHAIAERYGYPFEVRYESFPDRASALAWLFENQVSRRNLTPDQIVMLAAMRGVPSTRGTVLQRERAAALAAAGKGGPVLAGTLSIALAFGAHARANGTATPRAKAPRGPSTTPAIPAGHELAGVSTLTDADGSTKAAWNKTRIAGADEPPHDAVPPGHLIKSTSTMMRGDGTTAVQWIKASADEVSRERLMQEAWARHAELYRGASGVSVAPTSVDDDLLTVYPLGDPHIGMLSWAPETGDHFDVKIATRELLATVRALVANAPPARRAIVVNLGDFFHAQDDAQRTPGHGNKLDVDGRHAKVFDLGCLLKRGIVDAALERHAVVIDRNLPGNHDPQEASRIATVLRAMYEHDPRVTVADAFSSYQYDRFGVNLFGWHHGDGAKAEALPGIMATDRAEEWGQTSERVWHCGHVHHLIRKEFAGCTVETHRTMAGKDAWHAAKGYRSMRSLQAITYHIKFGEVARTTVSLARMRAALAGKAA